MNSKHYVSKKEMREVMNALSEIGLHINAEAIEISDNKKYKCYYLDGKPIIFMNGKIIPSIYLINAVRPDKNIVKIDAGAESHIINGSNLFAQGIMEMDQNIKENEMVFIQSEKGYFIAVGIAVRSAADIMADKKGLAIKTIHYPNDEFMKTFDQ
ncbi:MAG: DUF1947 domain-containing protein [Thermoplasmata archaeon]